MLRNPSTLLLIALLCSCSTTKSTVPIASEDPNQLPAEFNETMPLYEKALGDFSRASSSVDEKARPYFDQGFQTMYAFAKDDAKRSFREAWKRDPDCAMCYWGEAWAWGPYLNGKMKNEEAPHAYKAIQKALSLKEKADPLDQELIDAMAVRYAENFFALAQPVRDTAYADAMGKLYEKYPNDLEIGTLYAEALFLLEPRLGERDLEDPDLQRLHAVLEDVLEKDIKHVGACHLYIHATESTSDPGKAEGCAEYIGSSIPGASHINHMPSHTWNEIGRWGDAVRANIQAWHSDQKAEINEGFAIYPSHNLHMLLFAASMDGQGAIAMQAGRDYTKLRGNTMYEVLTMIRFGRFDEVLEVKARPEGDVPGGMWDFAQGYAHLRKGNIEGATKYLSGIEKVAKSSTDRFRFHDARHLLGTVGGILEGEIRRTQGRENEAILALERAVVFEDSLQYDEPEPIPFSARHWLGALLLETGQYTDAEQVYQDELDDHPNNGWSYFGLLKALEAQGKTDADLEEAFRKSWERSDTWIRGSRF
ncbi:MAG: tetratricopeptide repeat protein [Rhodothermaceae bacterium]|nr:tetratricopeptide repeat protein [Rhodothermaceae bacterium]